MVCELHINKTVKNKQTNQSSPAHPYNHIGNKREACLERTNYLETSIQITNLAVTLVSQLEKETLP